MSTHQIIENNTGLKILKKSLVFWKHGERKEWSLLHLFLNQYSLEGVRLWKNEALLRKEKKKELQGPFCGYIGLKPAM